jgi:hypothetical protein
MVGDQDDMLGRLKAVMPDGWFPDDSPVLDSWLSGLAAIGSWAWSLLDYVAHQRRITTATDVNLDLISSEFLGAGLPRRNGETDVSYRLRIKAAIFQEMGTRAAIRKTLTLLNGSAPTIFEPGNATDTGGWGGVGSLINTGLAYATSTGQGGAGGYGSYDYPFQAFIITNLPVTAIARGVQGYGRSTQGTAIPVIGAYGAGAIEYDSGIDELVSASDTDVYNAINAVKPVATIMWVATENTTTQPTPGGAPKLDIDFILNVSRLS